MQLSITELADAAGISRRAVRFYVAQGLLPAPNGLGRGRHYGHSHLERLRRIKDLQAAGHALDAIARILAGESVPLPSAPTRVRPIMTAGLWTRLNLGDGIEIHLDTRAHHPTAEQLVALRDAVRSILAQERQPQ